MPGKFDLHLHTTASDGMLEPEVVVAKAAAAGLVCIAVTDHDTTKGVERAQAEGARLGMPVLSGAEFSAEWTGELHILGYGMDIRSPAYLAFVEEQKCRRAERNGKMLKKIKALGMELPDEYTPAGIRGEYGRKHMALGMVTAGYADSIDQAFDKYLDIGMPAYAKRWKFTAAELISSIRDAGGHAVLAHPGRMKTSRDGLLRLVLELSAQGLDGIEAFYPSHTREEAHFYVELAHRAGLVCTYGSDWHGHDKAGLAYGFDDFDIPDDTYRWLQGLLDRVGGFQ